ncbi:hypothetical protein Bbelb_204320 [Branchiostoma belcheri]|nr:hypothetical protein Bbelb_204320 [Branchiostoma belcheri]
MEIAQNDSVHSVARSACEAVVFPAHSGQLYAWRSSALPVTRREDPVLIKLQRDRPSSEDRAVITSHTSQPFRTSLPDELWPFSASHARKTRKLFIAVLPSPQDDVLNMRTPCGGGFHSVTGTPGRRNAARGSSDWRNYRPRLRYRGGGGASKKLRGDFFWGERAAERSGAFAGSPSSGVIKHARETCDVCVPQPSSPRIKYNRFQESRC